jgi:hypothetical protein
MRMLTNFGELSEGESDDGPVERTAGEAPDGYVTQGVVGSSLMGSLIVESRPSRCAFGTRRAVVRREVGGKILTQLTVRKVRKVGMSIAGKAS